VTSYLDRLKSADVSTTKTLTETQRILALPVETYQDLEPGSITARLRLPDGAIELQPIQETALHAIEKCHGGLFPIGVGLGKTFIACLAGTILDSHFALILAPASTVQQFQDQYDMLQSHFRLVPAKIMSYAMLSRPDGTTPLNDIISKYSAAKVVLVCDEAHRLKRLESARTKRVIRFMQANPQVAFVALSGTLTSKSLKDFSHLAAMALRNGSPVPRDHYHLNTWAECIDVDGRPGRMQWRMMHSLAEWAGMPILNTRGQRRKTLVRKAFQHRLRTTTGVVASKRGSIECSLNLQLIEGIPVPDKITQLMYQISELGVDPAGEIITDDITAWRTTRHLAAGFYYRWDWPGGIEDRKWLSARRDWNRHVRSELQNKSREGYDSPFLVSQKVDEETLSGGHKAIHRSWIAWQTEKLKPTPPTVSVWVSPYLINHALEWLERQTEPAILWFESGAIGEALKEKGLPVYGAGDNPPTEAHNCGMSIKAHGIGKNLQKTTESQGWATQLVIEPPTGGLTWEQLLGRTHRQGSIADEVVCSVFQHLDPYTRSLTNAITEAQYIFDSSGNSQKLLFSTKCKVVLAKNTLLI